ncbi:hypothetical protein LCGC14_0166240 [marine sediment metagenome]|uniref:GIY-YIG domain-containing protein n=1 Tax=marine sediment metagenome TaxID=412755 RepID=A0A0F9XW56_9ZZZZ
MEALCWWLSGAEAENDNYMLGFMYFLKCSDGSYYTGSTNDLDKRMLEHQEGKGANHTRKRLPVKLVYVEEYLRIDSAFYREKQIQGWRREKKEALINGELDKLPGLAECQNGTHYRFYREIEE